MNESLLNKKMILAARFSLAFLWLFTAITSAFFAREEGFEILSGGGITGYLADFCLYSGSLLDAAIGFWLLAGKRLGLCYVIQFWIIIVYSLLLTVIDANFWLHPFGPITKNIPLLVLIYILFSCEK